MQREARSETDVAVNKETCVRPLASGSFPPGQIQPRVIGIIFAEYEFDSRYLECVLMLAA